MSWWRRPRQLREGGGAYPRRGSTAVPRLFPCVFPCVFPLCSAAPPPPHTRAAPPPPPPPPHAPLAVVELVSSPPPPAAAPQLQVNEVDVVSPAGTVVRLVFPVHGYCEDKYLSTETRDDILLALDYSSRDAKLKVRGCWWQPRGE